MVKNFDIKTTKSKINKSLEIPKYKMIKIRKNLTKSCEKFW